MKNRMRTILMVTAALLCVSEPLLAQRGRGGGGRGGGMRGGGGGRGFRGGGGGMPSRQVSRPNVSRPSGGFDRGSVSRPNVDRGNIDRGNVANRPNVDRPLGDRANIDRGNINIDRGNINADRGNINVGEIEVDGGRWNNGCCYNHPIAAGVAWGTAAALTAAAIGSVVYTLPPSCTMVYVGDDAYNQCDGVWYRPQFEGTTTTYVVVEPPQ